MDAFYVDARGRRPPSEVLEQLVRPSGPDGWFRPPRSCAGGVRHRPDLRPWFDDLGSRRGKAGLSLAVGLWLLIVAVVGPGSRMERGPGGAGATGYPRSSIPIGSPTGPARSPTSIRRRSSRSSRRSGHSAGPRSWRFGPDCSSLPSPICRACDSCGWVCWSPHRSCTAATSRSSWPWPSCLAFAGRPRWAFVILTKVTPGIGLLWFVVRREWRNLGIALAATAIVAGGSALTMPLAWQQWAHVLSRTQVATGHGRPYRSRWDTVADRRRPRRLGGQD